MVKFLIDNNADLSLRDVDGRTVLHRAAECNNNSIIRQVLALCPHLKQARDSKGNLALDYIKELHLKVLFD